MPSNITRDHSLPVSEADRQARAVFRHWCNEHGGPAAVARALDVSERAAQRIHRGERDVPPGLARQLAREIRRYTIVDRHAASWHDRAAQLDLWAEERGA